MSLLARSRGSVVYVSRAFARIHGIELRSFRMVWRRMEDRLQRQAHFDSLTGLPNRVLFFDRLKFALAQAKWHGRPVALVFVDVDRFKIVSDTLGHAVGDKVLQGIVDCLRHAVRAEDTVARLGGDEFAIVLPRLERPEHAALVAQKALTYGSAFYTAPMPDGGYEQFARKRWLFSAGSSPKTDEQLAFPAEHGCDEMQGYLFSAPLPSGELARFAATRH